MERETTVEGARFAAEVEIVDRLAVVLSRPLGAAAEQYRVLGQRLVGGFAAGRRRIGFTSPGRGEGRTVAALNVALALAPRWRVALVEADLRAPSLRTRLGPTPAVPGLVDVLAGAASLDDALLRLRDPPLGLLLAGAGDPHAAVDSPRTAALLAALAERFDAVLVDLPPALPTADVPALAAGLDGVVMLARAGRTRSETLALALAALPAGAVIGCALVGVSSEAGLPHAIFVEHDRRLAPAARRG